MASSISIWRSTSAASRRRSCRILSLFSRALFQTGTAKEDFVSLTQRIGRSTGGVGASRSISMMRDTTSVAAWLFVRGKVVPDKADELLSIITDVLTSAQLDNRERIKQMALEEKAGFESGIAGRGNGIAAGRLGASLNPASWANEQSSGVSYLFFLRELLKEHRQRRWLAQDQGRALRVARSPHRPQFDGAQRHHRSRHLERLPAQARRLRRGPARQSTCRFTTGPLAAPSIEGLTFPGQVNYVAKGANLYTLGYVHTGATSRRAAPPQHHLPLGQGARAGRRLWRLARASIRSRAASSSPRIATPICSQTLDAYDGAAALLREGIGEQDLVRSIIGAIGAIDTYRLPDAKGFTSLMWELTGNTDDNRQQRRDEILGATSADIDALRRRARRSGARPARWSCSAPKRRSRWPTTSAATS